MKYNLENGAKSSKRKNRERNISGCYPFHIEFVLEEHRAGKTHEKLADFMKIYDIPVFLSFSLGVFFKNVCLCTWLSFALAFWSPTFPLLSDPYHLQGWNTNLLPFFAICTKKLNGLGVNICGECEFSSWKVYTVPAPVCRLPNRKKLCFLIFSELSF